MHFLYQKLSERWPFLVVGLLLAGLWTTLLIQSSAALPTEHPARQVSYGLTLPNIMAPVIRQEMHKEASPEEERFTGNCLQLPGLWQLFSTQK